MFAVVDSFTKFIKLYATNTGAKESICALRRYFTDYSRPKRIISDRETAFSAMEFGNLCKEMNVEHVLNSTSSPRSNGQVERANRVLKAILAKVTDPVNRADWKQKLSEVEFAMNNTVHCATKQTPTKMLFGVEQRGKIVHELTEYLNEKYSVKEESLQEIRKRAVENIQKSQLQNQKLFEQKHKPAIEFEIGDLVVIKNVDTTVGKNKKLIPKYKGPYMVRKHLGHDRYVITDVENYQVTQIPYNGVVDSTRMKKWLEPYHCEKQVVTKGNTQEKLDDKLNDVHIDYEYLEEESSADGNVGDMAEEYYSDYEYLEDETDNQM